MNRFLALVSAAVLALGCAAPALAYTDEEQQELQIGQQVYQQLNQKGEIIRSSPYYTTLNSIAARITPVANKKYFTPFHFILVHESQPNAFAVPGGNVYVTDSMMNFAKNKEELAGVICHEVSHDIHHDVYDLYVKDQRLSLYATGLSLLLGGGRSQLANTLINLAANVQSLHFSRDVEHNADYTGAYICAQSGINPNGMVWLMEQFEANPTSSPPEFLSDHPSDSHRVQALHDEFAADPATFGKFNPDIACATPIVSSSWNNQYKGGGCGRRQSQQTGYRSAQSSSGLRRITPVSATSKPKCPPNWKYC
jgi:beta-barrel assembly-enhancing protease